MMTHIVRIFIGLGIFSVFCVPMVVCSLTWGLVAGWSNGMYLLGAPIGICMWLMGFATWEIGGAVISDRTGE